MPVHQSFFSWVCCFGELSGSARELGPVGDDGLCTGGVCSGLNSTSGGTAGCTGNFGRLGLKVMGGGSTDCSEERVAVVRGVRWVWSGDEVSDLCRAMDSQLSEIPMNASIKRLVRRLALRHRPRQDL